MGVVNTSYTFTATDTITSAKMNNIIDDTIMTGTAVSGSTLQVTPSGQLAVNSQGITSNELASASVIQTKIGPNVSGSGPAYSAYSSIYQPIPANNTDTVVQLSVEDYDTASCFNTSTYRFTPNVAGYYQINASAQIDNVGAGVLGNVFVCIRKNGTVRYDVSILAGANLGSFLGSGSILIYLNGSSDYLELICNMSGGTSPAPIILGDSSRTRMSGFLARSA